MKITQINAETKTNNMETTGNVDFKAIKLNRSSLKMAKPLEKDVLELKGKLPNNKQAKSNKYFGGYNPYGNDNNNYHNTEKTDAIVAGIGVAIGIALSLL